MFWSRSVNDRLTPVSVYEASIGAVHRALTSAKLVRSNTAATERSSDYSIVKIKHVNCVPDCVFVVL
jgi:hypothetical protein